MAKKIIILALVLAVCGQLAFSQVTKFAVDGGAGLSFGIMKSTGDSTVDALGGLVTFFATLRGALYGNLRYEFTDLLSAGVQLGIYAITYTDSSNNSATLIDVPAHAIVRFGTKSLAAEGFAGYYLSVLKSDTYNFGGLEFGGKVFLGPVYGGYSWVLANPQYNRIEVGVQLTKLAHF